MILYGQAVLFINICNFGFLNGVAVLMSLEVLCVSASVSTAVAVHEIA